MKIHLKNSLYALMLAIMIFAITACSSSTKEDQASASNTPYSETSQAPSDSPSHSSESASVSPEPATPTATESASPSASVEPSASATESHEHELSPEPSASKPAPEPSEKPSASKPTSEPSEKPSASEPSPEASDKPTQEVEDSADKVTIVEIKDFAFSPEKVTIRKGGTVKFINRDKVKHTATADGGEFDTGLIGKDVASEFKFDDKGTFTYYCAPHPGMTGSIEVEDK